MLCTWVPTLYAEDISGLYLITSALSGEAVPRPQRRET